MITRAQRPSPRVHLPLGLLALCLDCDECFEIAAETCPACGSATWTSLSRFLAQASSPRPPRGREDGPAPAERPDQHRETTRQLVIVARNRGHLYEHLQRAFAGNHTVRVLLNRRVVERRERCGPYEAERREGNRRSPLKTDGLLREIGCAILPQDVAGNHGGAPG
ncbi:MAG TPA: hypothetical protein VGV13_05010 [Methylomirabilota bacterium]|jgi:hypothetical protein|nr:hypothetical protein [Methylomirabilota bacterium]